jgi:hypothetical protein
VRDGYDPLQYIRDYYKVPAYVGRVVYAGGKRGVVVGASGPHLKVNLDTATCFGRRKKRGAHKR